jgi:hypothetical protein
MAVAAIAVIFLYNFLLGVKAMRDVRSGHREIARWTVTARELDEFRINDTARNALGPAYRNDYEPPNQTPAGGVEVVFLDNGVAVGGSYFGLTTTGLYRFAGVRILPQNPLAIEFGTVLTAVTPRSSSFTIDTSGSVLRVPVSRLARGGATKVLNHFRMVDEREIIVNPGFYRGRVRAGLIAAPIFFLIAAGGFWLSAVGADRSELPLVMAVGGVIAGFGGLILAFAAWILSLSQHRRR